MRFLRLWPIGLIALALASAGCNSGRKNPANTVVRVLNATAHYPALAFHRGPKDLNPLAVDFLGGDQTTWDEDTYNFHVTYFDIASQAQVQVDQFSRQVSAGTWSTFVLYEKGGNVTHTVLDSKAISSSATDVQVQAIHVVEGVQPLDVYLEPPGTAILGASPWGTVAFESSLPARNIPAGDYVLTATEHGNPAHVLYTSTQFTLSAAASVTFAFTPDSGEGIQPFSMTVLNDSSAVLVDPSLPSAVRVINGAADRQPRDVAFNNEFTPPLFPGTVFGTATPYLPLVAGTGIPLNVTPAGNPGVLEFTGTITTTPATSWTVLVVGPTGTLFTNEPQDARRRVKSQVKLTFYNAATSCTLCDVLILPAGNDPNNSPALDPIYGTDPYQQVTLGSVVPATQVAGNYEVVVRPQGTTNVVSGPTPITLKDAGLYGIVLTDNPNGTTIDMTLIDDFQ